MGILSTNHHIIGIANGGVEYTAGDYIKIYNNEISVTGLVSQTDYSTFSSHMTACCNDVSAKVDANSASITSINNNITNISSTVTALNQNALTAISHDSTLSGNGTPSSPLSVVGSAPTDGYTLLPGAYVSFDDDDTNKTTTVSVTGANGFATVESLNTKQDVLSAGTSIAIENNTVSYTGVPISIVTDATEATGMNILYVVTGAN